MTDPSETDLLKHALMKSTAIIQMVAGGKVFSERVLNKRIEGNLKLVPVCEPCSGSGGVPSMETYQGAPTFKCCPVCDGNGFTSGA